MLLRSSSTPLLRSVLSESPNWIGHHEISSLAIHPPSPFHPSTKSKLSFHQLGHYHLNSISCGSSPISPSVSEFSDSYRYPRSGFRRARSEGNLENLAYVSEKDVEEQFFDSYPHKHSMLQSIPSFTSEGVETDDGEEEEEEFGPIARMTDMITTNQELSSMGFEKEKDLTNQNMYPARGVGVDDGDCASGGGFGRGVGGVGGGNFSSGNSGHDDHGVEEYYKKMVEENPGNPLFLRNYAHFLCQRKGDLHGAEEYYSRAILADPKDGEVLSQYAKLVWELHRDQARAASYFERAVQASAHDSHVLAAYASFLWETEEEEEEELCAAEEPVNIATIKSQFNQLGSLRAGAV